MIKLLKAIVTLSIIFFLHVFNTSAQTQRPKVGLVLSGGGAKGIAHIGVLKAMEKAGIRPDYITGTSMGSIIGGLYASGYSADELEALVLAIEWDELLTDEIPFNSIFYPEKEYNARYFAEVYIDNKKILLPKGIINAQPLNVYFSELTRHVQGLDSFDQLPIPFACVGANIVTGKPVVLNSGSLSRAMRASMALPSIFSPVKIDSNLLVDGGLLRNLPVDEVIEMGADIVIGVMVSSDLHPEDELKSAMDILFQATFINSAFDSREQLKKCNLVIKPDLRGFSTGSFSDAEAIFERGVEAGNDSYQLFKQLADSLDQFGQQAEIREISLSDKLQIDSIEIIGNKRLSKEYILSRMRLSPGLVCTSDITVGIKNLIGSLLVKSAYYEILPLESGHVLKLFVEEKLLNELKFSFHFDTDNKGGILLNTTLRDQILNNSRLVFEADLASFPRLSLDYLKFFDKKRLIGLKLKGTYLNNELPVSESEETRSLIYNSRYLNFSTSLEGFHIRNSTFGADYSLIGSYYKPKIGSGILRTLTKIEYVQEDISIFIKHNSYNQRYYPKKGVKASAVLMRSEGKNAQIEIGDTLTLKGSELGNIFDRDPFMSLWINFEPIIKISNRLSILGKARFRFSDLTNSNLNLSAWNYIGGNQSKYYNTLDYYGVPAYEFVALNFFYGYLGTQWEVKNNLYTQLHFNYLESAELVGFLYPGFESNSFGDRSARYAFAAELAYVSPIGPISVGVAKDVFREDLRTFLSIGFYY